MADLSYIEALAHAIEQGFSCKAKHLETVSVKEVFQGKTVWEGEVEVFELTGHQTAKRAYGWGFHTEDKKAEFATVLGVPPITSPQKAVQAYIINKNRP